MPDRVRASIIVVTFQHHDLIQMCLAAVLKTIDPDDEVIVVDNASPDGTADVVATYASHVRLVRAGSNLGFAGGCNLGATVARGEHLVFLNPDTEPRAGWLGGLCDVLRAIPDAGLVGPKLLQSRRPSHIDTLGVRFHISGIPTSRAWGDLAGRHVALEEVASVSGACFAMTRSLFVRLAGFDERAWYMEDMDLSLRARLAGYRCLVTPGAEVLHVHPPGVWAQKYFYVERSRWWLILKIYRWRTIVGLVPTLFVAEIVSWAFALLSGPGHLAAKVRAWVDLLRWLPELASARRGVQRSRVVSDRELLRLHDTRLRFNQVAPRVVAEIGEALTTLVFAATRLVVEATAE